MNTTDDTITTACCAVCFEPFKATKTMEEDHRPVHSAYCSHTFCMDCFCDYACPVCCIELPNVDQHVNQMAVHLLSINDTLKEKIFRLGSEKEALVIKTSAMHLAIEAGRQQINDSSIVNDALQDEMHKMWTETTAATAETRSLRLENDALRSIVDHLQNRENKIRLELDLLAQEAEDFISDLIDNKNQLKSEIETMNADMKTMNHKNTSLISENEAMKAELETLHIQHRADSEAYEKLICQTLNAKSGALKVSFEKGRINDENAMLYQDIDSLKARNRKLQKRYNASIRFAFAIILTAFYFGKLVGQCMHTE